MEKRLKWYKAEVALLWLPIAMGTVLIITEAVVYFYVRRPAISAKAVLLTNSSSRSDQSRIFFQAKTFFSKRFAHTWSQTSQDLMSFTHSFICFSVNFSGSSIIAATILASGVPFFHSSSASLWFLLNSFAIFRMSGTDTPNLRSATVPYRAIPSS